jgi:uncharacterized protein
MEMFFASVLVMATVIAAMAIGVMFGREPIKGSCGGVGAAGIDSNCDICGGSPARCEAERGADDASSARRPAFYEASRRD